MNNLLELQTTVKKATSKRQGAEWLVNNTKTQMGWGLIYDRIDADFIKQHSSDNFAAYLATCKEEELQANANFKNAMKAYKTANA